MWRRQAVRIKGKCCARAVLITHRFPTQVVDKKGKTVEPLKLRGIKLNVEACDSLGYTQFRERVLRWAYNPKEEEQAATPVLLEYRMLRPQKSGSIYTVRQSKKYEPYYQKGVVRSDLTIVPFGWCDNE